MSTTSKAPEKIQNPKASQGDSPGQSPACGPGLAGSLSELALGQSHVSRGAQGSLQLGCLVATKAGVAVEGRPEGAGGFAPSASTLAMASFLPLGTGQCQTLPGHDATALSGGRGSRAGERMEMSSAPAQDKPVAPASCLRSKGPRGAGPSGRVAVAWPGRAVRGASWASLPGLPGDLRPPRAQTAPCSSSLLFRGSSSHVAGSTSPSSFWRKRGGQANVFETSPVGNGFCSVIMLE